MSIKELKEGKTKYGIREVLKLAKAKKLKKGSKIFVSRDARDETIEQLENAGVEFEVLKNKDFISKELGLDFESEVYLVL
jgi:hypothetical protein